MKKKLLFVVGSLTIGGIETYISRLTIHLKKHYDIYVLVITDKVNVGLFDVINQNANVIFFKDVARFKSLAKLNYSAISHSLSLDFKLLEKLLPNLDVIHSVDSETSIMALDIAKNYNANLVISTYHPLEFVWENGFYFRAIQKNLVREMCPSNIFYMNEAVKLETVNHLGVNDRDNDIIPLGVDLSIYRNCEPNFKSNKIVSIGRLVDFKTYNEAIIKNLDLINERCNRDFEFHIYGDGPLRLDLEQLAVNQKSKIVFHGGVEYQRLPRIFEDAFVFVGVGTTIIEASAAGVPSILGTGDFSSMSSYGFFSDNDNYLVGEKCQNGITTPFIDLFEDICSCDHDAYLKISEYHRLKAGRFDILEVSKMFAKELDSQSEIEITLDYSRFRYFISNLCWLSTNFLGFRKDRKSRYNMVI